MAINRKVTVHSTHYCRLTGRAQLWTQVLNNYMRKFPTTSLKDLANYFDLSYTNARRYYYGMHHKNASGRYMGRNQFVHANFNQVRFGVKVDL